jgi:protein-S-isoprenylcysteine O-methyltransferase Ste14
MKLIYRLRGWLMVPPMIFIVLCTRHECENALLVWGLGGLTFAWGLALRLWSQMHLHYRIRVKKMLTVTGPYAYVRNPIYIANTTMFAAICMLAELFWFVPILVLYCGVIYALAIRYEESRLLRKYGSAYQEYASRVPRVFPKLRWSNSKAGSVRHYVLPSVLVEAHNLLFLLPLAIKELITH